MLTANENRNLHIFGISESKLKSHKTTGAFLIEGFQKSFRKDNDFNGGGGLLVYVKNGINAKRREDPENNNISCSVISIMHVLFSILDYHNFCETDFKLLKTK